MNEQNISNNNCDINDEGTSEINDENIIGLCIKNILDSTLEKNIHCENFLVTKNIALNNFIKANNVSEDNIKVSDTVDDDAIPYDIIYNEDILNIKNDDDIINEDINYTKELKNYNTNNSNIYSFNNNESNEINKKKVEKKRKRNYLNINDYNFDYDEEDFVTSSNEVFLKTHNDNDNTSETSKIINMDDDIIKNLIMPPVVPFNDMFKKFNKEISDIYIKNKNNNIEDLNIFLASQLLCLEEKEDTFINENNFINSNFDSFILKKLKIINDPDCNNFSNQNKDLQKLFMYLMSWYFSGYYSGKMSVLKELYRQ
ncbi:hypothetical protein CYL21_5647 [Plasmodium falciparum NF54]|uniref:Uncharacterized protein n=3 Tax=Plasmodium falciparum TaxID=5833 RepID=A0A5K1K912_PLAF7|nr:conserved Plasmodium protein, unknown function [Plasmodium falciparum 3D7]EWC86523.1 hypothetical protein PFNF54_04539 [Plasmodium falciparum NF54]KAF4326663.1 hypothetical protein CYL21_5647 [Plasmodium falciparum NF54]PKC44639.1 hypothetical protein CK202_4455 [Plasmodium falciparum NF54]VWP77921.1 conserved Plasmodium protein, unknown function [Plasmodium falciparum 3D7]|eukprot:XP_001350315.1 conserved Plasmodium protein, unknown function [Plasmodium falciparum 3D7]